MIEIRISGKPEECLEQFRKLAAAFGAVAEEAEKPAPAEPPVKAQEAPSEPVQEPVRETPVEAEEPAQNEKEPAKHTFVELRGKANALRQAHGVEAVKAVLNQLGVAKLTDITEEQYDTAWTLIEASEAGYAAQ